MMIDLSYIVDMRNKQILYKVNHNCFELSKMTCCVTLLVCVTTFWFIELVIVIILLLIFVAVLDIIMSWKARQSMTLHVQLRYILKAVTAAAWVIVLPVTYAYSWDNASGFAQTIKGWFGNGSSSPSLFLLAILIYLSPNMLSVVLFLFPFIRRGLERSDYKIVRFIMWWSQVFTVSSSTLCWEEFS